MEKIDKLDKQIMEIISCNARIPFKDVAAECGVSRAAIHQRVQRLIDMNVIVGSGYHVCPKSLGYTTCTYVGIKLEKGSMYKRVVGELSNIPEIVECHFTTGPYSMLIKLYARDNEQLMDLLNNKIQAIHGVDSTETLISLDQSIKKEIPIRFNSKENRPNVDSYDTSEDDFIDDNEAIVMEEDREYTKKKGKK
jgi:Lrp/AsnC family transcriptional regulator for asnA, asnC and gidA